MSAVPHVGRRVAVRVGDSLRRWRNRIIESQRFQRLAARFPLTRGIANRKARALTDLCMGFVHTQVLTSCVRLGLFDLLAPRPLSVDQVAQALDLPRDSALRLLRAAASLELLVETAEERFALGDLGAALRGNPGIAAIVRHHALLYADLQDPLPLLRGQAGETHLQRYWAYARGDQAGGPLQANDIDDYTRLMAASQGFVAEDILAAYPFGRHRAIMDVGGGDGSFLRAVARHAPQARLTLFDLPAVAETARAHMTAAGLLARVTIAGGDFTIDALPGGHDLITLIRIAHDHDDDVVQPLLGRLHAALAPDGVLLIGEPLAGQKGAEAMADAYFGFYFLAMGQGRARRPAEFADMLSRAGFVGVRQIRTPRPLMTGVIVARKAAN